MDALKGLVDFCITIRDLILVVVGIAMVVMMIYSWWKEKAGKKKRAPDAEDTSEPQKFEPPEPVELPIRVAKGSSRSLDNAYVTPEKVLECLKDPTFVKSVKKNLLEHFQRKKEMYEDLMTENPDHAPYLQKIVEDLEASKEDLTEDSIKKNFTLAILSKKNGILSLKGESRKRVRDQLATILYSLSKSSRTLSGTFLGWAVSGDSGIGKTKFIKVLAYVYAKSGINLYDDFVKVSRQDLVKGWVGQSEGATSKKFLECLESVLLIDEAHSLESKESVFVGNNDFGKRVIQTLVDLSDRYKGFIVMAMAGYGREMDDLFRMDQGLKRRFPNNVVLTEYSANDLYEIFETKICEIAPDLIMSPEERGVMLSVVTKLHEGGFFPRHSNDAELLAYKIADVRTRVEGVSTLKVLRMGVDTYLENHGCHIESAA